MPYLHVAATIEITEDIEDPCLELYRALEPFGEVCQGATCYRDTPEFPTEITEHWLDDDDDAPSTLRVTDLTTGKYVQLDFD
jgi:hypothetical protein